MKIGQSATMIAVNDEQTMEQYLLQQTMRALLNSLTPQQRVEVTSRLIETMSKSNGQTALNGFGLPRYN